MAMEAVCGNVPISLSLLRRHFSYIGVHKERVLHVPASCHLLVLMLVQRFAVFDWLLLRCQATCSFGAKDTEQ